MNTFEPLAAIKVLTELHHQSKSIPDQNISTILVNVTHFIVQLINYYNEQLNLLPLSLNQLNEKFDSSFKLLRLDIGNQVELLNEQISKSQKFHTFQPQFQTNLFDLLTSSFHLNNCKELLQNKLQEHKDDLCQQILNRNQFYPKMLDYLSQIFHKKIIVYVAKKKRYFVYGKYEELIFLYQKNPQIFNVMQKKQNRNNSKQQSSQRKQPQQSSQNWSQQIEKSLQKSISKVIANQIQSVQKQVAFQTPKSKSFKKQKLTSPDSSPRNSDFEENIRYSYICGGKFESCKKGFSNLDGFQKHIKTIHRSKTPKNSSHDIAGNILQ